MCQATVYLDDKEIMRDVILVEPLLEGVRLVALFEPVQVIPAAIHQIDLLKHKVILISKKGTEDDERARETQSANTPLDRA
jgi:predicted RNA-binding protein